MKEKTLEYFESVKKIYAECTPEFAQTSYGSMQIYAGRRYKDRNVFSSVPEFHKIR